MNENTINNYKIVVIYHKNYPIYKLFLDNNHYILLQYNDFSDKRFVTDTSRYSNLNKYINEATGFCWLYENYEKLGNPEYLGLFHYHRMLNLNNIYVNEKTIITSTASLWHPVKEDFKKCVSDKAYEYLILMIKLTFNDTNQEILEKILNDWLNLQSLYLKNMFIIHKTLFLKYILCLYLIINDIVLKNLNDEMLLEMIRSFGYCIEWYTGFYLYYCQNVLKYDLKLTNLITV